jgi:pimeloyl-ACP methyl ester carboxylesterase
LQHVSDRSFPFEVPQPSERADLVLRDGAVIRLRRYGNPNGARLALSHGNGLAINAYAPFWLPLADRFDLILFDIRHHGENPFDLPGRHDWPTISEDFEEIFCAIQRRFGPACTVGLFHSLSAVAALNHTLAHGRRWAALALFDPPIFPRAGHPLAPVQTEHMLTHAQRATRRPESYARAGQLAAQIARRHGRHFSHPQTAMLMAQHTLRPGNDGRWHLRHPRELEALIFRSNTDATLWPRMRDLRIPTLLIGSDPAAEEASPSAHVCRAIHDELGIPYVAIPGTSHFLQMEDPQACRDAVMAFLCRHRLLERSAG